MSAAIEFTYAIPLRPVGGGTMPIWTSRGLLAASCSPREARPCNDASSNFARFWNTISAPPPIKRKEAQTGCPLSSSHSSTELQPSHDPVDMLAPSVKGSPLFVRPFVTLIDSRHARFRSADAVLNCLSHFESDPQALESGG